MTTIFVYGFLFFFFYSSDPRSIGFGLYEIGLRVSFCVLTSEKSLYVGVFVLRVRGT